MVLLFCSYALEFYVSVSELLTLPLFNYTQKPLNDVFNIFIHFSVSENFVSTEQDELINELVSE